jgi:hypothetical protein
VFGAERLSGGRALKSEPFLLSRSDLAGAFWLPVRGRAFFSALHRLSLLVFKPLPFSSNVHVLQLRAANQADSSQPSSTNPAITAPSTDWLKRGPFPRLPAPPHCMKGS